jgi:hypothetical protein
VASEAKPFHILPELLFIFFYAISLNRGGER